MYTLGMHMHGAGQQPGEATISPGQGMGSGHAGVGQPTGVQTAPATSAAESDIANNANDAAGNHPTRLEFNMD